MKRAYPFVALQLMVDRAGSQKAVAAKLGISQAYLCDLLAGRRHFSKAMLAKLGMEQVIVKATAKS